MIIYIYRTLKKVLILHILLLATAATLNSQPPSHDPTHMVKDGDRYWIFTTGNGIWKLLLKFTVLMVKWYLAMYMKILVQSLLQGSLTREFTRLKLTPETWPSLKNLL